MANTTTPALRQIIVPVADIEQALGHYRDGLGLELRFQDGNRWAALGLGDLTLALAGPGEYPADEVTLGIKVGDLEEALAQLESSGGERVGEIREGAHERRITCRDALGTMIVLYAPLA